MASLGKEDANFLFMGTGMLVAAMELVVLGTLIVAGTISAPPRNAWLLIPTVLSILRWLALMAIERYRFPEERRWIRTFERSRLRALDPLERKLEQPVMSKPDFAYAIYIDATREEVWNGLLEPEFTRQYWFHDNVSDWQEGSRWESRATGGEEKVDVVGRVLESELYEKLVLTWARPGDEDDPERTSRVTFRLGDVDWPGGPWTSLHLEHTDFGEDHEMRDSVSGGWPMVLSGLKTLLEKGFDHEEAGA